MRDKQLERLCDRIDAFALMYQKDPAKWRGRPLATAAWINRGL